MINKNKFKKRAKKTLIKFLLGATVLGIMIGGFFSFNFMGTTEETIRMNNFEFSKIDISKASRILGSLEKGIKDEDLENAVIEWFMYKETYNKMASRLQIDVSKKEVSDFITNLEMFKNQDGDFSTEKYKNYLKVNVVEAEFYESLVKDEILINKLKSILDPEVFKMNDPTELADKLNKEYDILLLVADTDKMTNFTNIDDIKKFISQHKEYLELIVSIETIIHNENISLGQFNVLKNKKNDLNKIINKSTVKNQEISIKNANNKINDVILTDSNYFYKDKNSFYKVSFKNKEKSESIIKNLNAEFQYNKKTEFLTSYINKMLENNKSFENIADSQDYFELDKEKTNFKNSLVNQYGRQKLAKSQKGDEFHLDSKPFHVTIKVLDINKKNVINKEEFEDYYQQNMEIMFLKLLNKTAIENY